MVYGDRRPYPVALITVNPEELQKFAREQGVLTSDPASLVKHPKILERVGRIVELTGLATLVVLGPVARFPTSRHVVSYVGLAPAVASSAGKHRVGRITKRGNSMLRHILGQAAQTAVRCDADLKRLYYRVLQRRGKARAKVAAAQALLVRLYIMRRDRTDYAEFRRRGVARAA